PSTARVLDCACGIGTQALGLAQKGFRVHGCDISSRAVERARLEASRKGLDAQFSVANMLDLSSLVDSTFDAVMCMDNSLPHLESVEQLSQAQRKSGRGCGAGAFSWLAAATTIAWWRRGLCCKGHIFTQTKGIGESFFRFGIGSIITAILSTFTSLVKSRGVGARFIHPRPTARF
ncbi:MAG TPA: class I SAM-dependent methyltransferase, partial [Terriglobales bacterium]|nr:class I SAM-dependent methyltransferase [Terriglobales bacterium]